MKDFQKLLYNRNGSQLSVGLDLEKIDHGDRVVVGFATLDNMDFAGDIISANASIDAFKKFRGNVRSQHDQHKPVGRVIAFQPASYYDEETKKSYTGVKVAVRVSEGAEDIWKMCQDGTLSGFSIGGKIKKARRVWNAELKKNVQIIDEIMFTELSLVDNPMNGLANITAISVHKSLDYDTIEKGFDTMNLFWCAPDKLAEKSAGLESDCPSCGEPMANMGHIEENVDIEKQLEAIFEVDTKGGHPEVGDTEITIEKAVDAEDNSAEVLDDGTQAEATEPEAGNEAEESQAAEATETAEGESDESGSTETLVREEDSVTEGDDAPANELAKAISQIQEVVGKSQETLEKGQSELREEFNTLNEEIQKQLAALSGSYKELDERVQSVTEKLNSTTEDLQETQKRLDSVATGKAVRKSLDSQVADTETAPAPDTKKSLFSGVFKP